MRDEKEYRYGKGELIGEQSESSRELRARMGHRDNGDVSPGPGAMHRNAELLLAGGIERDLGGGVKIRRDALGGISISTGNLVERMNTAVQQEPEPEPQLKARPALAHPAGVNMPSVPPSVHPSAPDPFPMPTLPDFNRLP